MKNKSFKQLLKEGVATTRENEWESLDPSSSLDIWDQLDEGMLDKIKGAIAKVFPDAGKEEGEFDDEDQNEIGRNFIIAYQAFRGKGCEKGIPMQMFRNFITDFKKTERLKDTDIETLTKIMIKGLVKCPDGSDFDPGGATGVEGGGEGGGEGGEGGEGGGGRGGGGGEEGETGPDPSGKIALAKDTPLSIMKKQKDVKAGHGGKAESPLVMHIQQLGVSQRTAQQLAKRVGEYLKQRKIPIAEAISGGLLERIAEGILMNEEMVSMEEATTSSQIQSSIFGQMSSLFNDKASDEKKAKSAEYVLAVHSVANQPDPEKFRRFIQKRIGGWLTTPEGAQELADLSEDELKALMDYVKTSDKFKRYHQAGKELRQAKKDKKGKIRSDIRDVGKEAGIIGKIISRFVSDNQKMIEDDPALAKIMAMSPDSTKEDEVKFKKFVKKIRKMLQRQLARRGYEAAEIGKLLETALVNEAISRYILKEVQSLHENNK